MASREFHGVIFNQWENPLFGSADNVDSGEWQDPWYPSRRPGAGRINPQESGEWRSESDGIMTGTSGWARWGVRVMDEDDHFEYIQVNWSVPFLQTEYPNITCAVFRNNPDESDLFARHDPRPPLLEIVPAVKSADGSVRASSEGDTPALAQFGQIVPYVLSIPASFFLTPLFGAVTHPRVHFIVRRRASSPARSVPTFATTAPTSLPSRQMMIMQAFRHRMEAAAEAGFGAGFPNFNEATRGRDHVGGTIFIKLAAAEWRDVPLVELGNVSLEDFGERMRATNAYASRNGFVGALPTFFHAAYGNGIVCGTVLLRAGVAEWRDIPSWELGDPALDDFEARFRATQAYATRNGFVGGFPNLFHTETESPLIAVDLNDQTRERLGELGKANVGGDRGPQSRPEDAGSPLRRFDLNDQTRKRLGELVQSRSEDAGSPLRPLQARKRLGELKKVRKVRITVCGTILLKQGFAELRDVVLGRDPA